MNRKFMVCVLTMLFSATAAAAPDVGDAAPDWTLDASDGKQYSLTDLRGSHVVIAFFPKAFTSG